MAEFVEVSSSESESGSESGLEILVGFSSVGTEWSDDAFKAELEECLDSIRTTGAFALFEHLPSPPNPGLTLKNGGGIGLPLSDRDAEAFVAASRLARVENDTLTNETPKQSRENVWELPASDFQLENPQWKDTIYTLVKKVTGGLGIAAGGNIIHAELDNMILSYEGAVPPTSMSLKVADQVFGTLLIVLPSKHEGGEVCIRHSGKAEMFNPSEHSAFDNSYLAWFLDADHEVKPILSGRRLTITYKLLYDNLRSEGLTASSTSLIQRLESLLQSWKQNANLEEQPAMAYMLEHNYEIPKEAEMYTDILKGHDKQVITNLEQACKASGIELYIGHLERTVTGGCDADAYDYMDEWDHQSHYSTESHEIKEVHEDKYLLEHVAQLDGSVVAKHLNFDKELFIHAVPFMDIDPDEREFEESPPGGQPSTKNVYYRTIVLLVPRTHLAEFFFSPIRDIPHNGQESPAFQAELQHLTGQLGHTPKPEDIERFEKLCHVAIRHMRSWISKAGKEQYLSTQPPFALQLICDLVHFTRYIDNKEIFLDLFPMSLRDVTLSTSWVFESVAVALSRYGGDSIFPLLSAEIAKRSFFFHKMTILNAFKNGIDVSGIKTSFEDETRFTEWFKGEVLAALASTALRTREDAYSLVTVSYKVDLQATFDHVLPSVKRNVHNTTMTVEYLNALADEISNSDRPYQQLFPRDAAITVFKDIACDLADIFSLDLFSISVENLANPHKRTMTNSGSYNIPQEPLNANPAYDSAAEINRKIAALLWKYCEYGLTDNIAKITARLFAESMTCTVDKFEVIYLPLLKNLIEIFKREDHGSKKHSFGSLFRNIISSYIVRFVGFEPPQPNDWRRLPRGCGCADCWQLDQFLVDPSKPIGYFKLAEGRRNHLRDKILHWHQCMVNASHGTPYTLIVTKTLREFTMHYEWTLRHQRAGMRINQLGLAELQALVGDFYEDIATINVGRLAHLVQPSNNSEPALLESTNIQNRNLQPRARKVPARPSDDEIIVID